MPTPSSFALALCLGLCLAAGAACADSPGSPGQAVPAASSRVVTPGIAKDGTSVPLSQEGCEVRGPAPGGPVNDPQGPYFHQVAIARTTDGIHLSDARLVIEHASVPDGVRLADGSVRIYYVNGASQGVFVARFDGVDVTPIGPITLNGIERPAGVVDSDATLMPDGKVRLAYMSGFGAPGASSGWTMCLAESADGVNFTVLGQALRFTSEVTTDPSITQLADGSWLMAVSQGQKTALASSADGLRFALFTSVTFGGVPEVSALPDGRVRLYVCGQGGIGVYVSGDSGRTWTREATMLNPLAGTKLFCDPSVVAGTDLFVFKAGQ